MRVAGLRVCARQARFIALLTDVRASVATERPALVITHAETRDAVTGLVGGADPCALFAAFFTGVQNTVATAQSFAWRPAAAARGRGTFLTRGAGQARLAALFAGIAHAIAATRYGDAAVTTVVVTALVGAAGKPRFATFLPGIPLAIAAEGPITLAATRTLVAFLVAGA